MDLNRINILLQRFFDGKSSEAEERELEQFLAKDPEQLPEQIRADAQYFKYLKEQRSLKFDSNKIESGFLDKIDEKQEKVFDLRRYKRLLFASAVAASIVLMFVFYNNFNNKQSDTLNTAHSEIQDPDEAYAEVKNALMTVSVNFNEGAEGFQKISSFDKAQKSLNKEEIK
ncbi:MAG: hypothetical protein HKN22_04860 [Bacteroidia bacterium]|nr:hypothetical protein [Bacteroidia bacterium]